MPTATTSANSAPRSKKAPKNAVAVTPGGAITDDMIIGHYYWIGIPEQYKSAVTIKKNWKAAGLPEDKLPRERQKVHVAQEAIRSIEGDASNGIRRRVIVNEVEHTSGSVTSQVTLQIWDQENRVIEHEKSMRVTFDKKLGDFAEFEQLDPDAQDHLEGLEERIREHFEAHATRMPGAKMRWIIRTLLQSEGAENMSDSGKSAVYYITAEKTDVLKAVGQFLAETYKGDGNHAKGSLHSVPVINDEGQREFLKARFVQNCEDDLQRFRDKLLDLVRKQGDRKRGFRSDMLHNLREERAQLIDRREKFSELLSDTLTELDQSSRLADSALTKLMAQADV